MSKNVLILVGIPEFDYSNEQSAVLLFLKTIKGAFEADGYLVEFAESSNFTVPKMVKTESSKGFKEKLKSLLKKWTWLYQTIAYRNYFARQDLLLQRLLSGKSYKHIVEFHTVGSVIGKELSKKWDANFSVIFDSPVDEQFYEMHNTKTAYWSRIVNSEKETLQAADSIMVYSPACEDYIRNKYELVGQVNVLPCVINKESVINLPEDNSFRIVFIGSFLSWHKVELLVNVFEQFYKNNPIAKLELIGYGVEWKRIKSLIEQKGLTGVVDMPGFVSEEELLRYKRGCSVALMPGSNWYGSPLKLFEYAQSGIPFIAPLTKTVSSIFKDETHCLYIDVNNEEKSLLERLTFLYENPLKRKEMAIRARDYVRDNFEDMVYAKKLVGVLLKNNK